MGRQEKERRGQHKATRHDTQRTLENKTALQNSRDARILEVMSILVNTYHLPVNGAAGLVGNLMAESGAIPERIEGSRPETPMTAHDFTGQTSSFAEEQIMNRSTGKKQGPRLPGVGLAQWTYPPRRRGLFEHIFQGQRQGAAILHKTDAQLDYLIAELQSGGFAQVYRTLMQAGVSVNDASDEVVYHFERPGSILHNHKNLPRDHQAVQAVFTARRNLSQHALNVFQSHHDNSLAEPRRFEKIHLLDEHLTVKPDLDLQELMHLYLQDQFINALTPEIILNELLKANPELEIPLSLTYDAGGQPREAKPIDLFRALLNTSEAKKLVTQFLDQIGSPAELWQKLSTTDKAILSAHVAVMTSGFAYSLFSDRENRILSKLPRELTIPIPSAKWLTVQFSFASENFGITVFANLLEGYETMKR